MSAPTDPRVDRVARIVAGVDESAWSRMGADAVAHHLATAHNLIEAGLIVDELPTPPREFKRGDIALDKYGQVWRRGESVWYLPGRKGPARFDEDAQSWTLLVPETDDRVLPEGVDAKTITEAIVKSDKWSAWKALAVAWSRRTRK